MLGRLKFDIDELVTEMLDSYPPDVIIHGTVLDPAIGGGQFVKEVERRKRAAGKTDKEIRKTVFGFEENVLRLDYAVNKHNLVGTYQTNFSDKDFKKMKFDAIVGNPPFKDSSNESSYTNLWSKIYKKSFQLLDDDGYMAMVTPKTWATPKQENRESQTTEIKEIIKNHAVVVNIDECARHFPDIGSTFSYSIVSKKPNTNKAVLIKTPDGDVNISDISSVINRLPKNISKESIEIFRKVFSKPCFEKEKGTTPGGEMIHDRDRTGAKIKQYPYRVQYSAGTVKWSNTKNKYQDKKKVLFPNQTTHNYPIYDPGISAPPNRGAVFLVNNDKEGKNFVHFVKSNLMQFVIQEQRFHHGMLNTEVVSKIPKIDLTKKLTNEEIYKLFDLSPEEIAYVEANT